MSDNIKLEDPSVAYGYAGFDKNFTFFKIYTRPVTINGELGQYHADYQGYLPALEAAIDPVGWLRSSCNVMLQHMMKETGLPADQWVIEFSPIMERFKIPSHLFLNRPKDREWLG